MYCSVQCFEKLVDIVAFYKYSFWITKVRGQLGGSRVGGGSLPPVDPPMLLRHKPFLLTKSTDLTAGRVVGWQVA